MLWSQPLFYYLIGNSSSTIRRHSFVPDQLERGTELSINLPHFLVDGQPRWKRNAERTTTLSADEFAESITGYISTMTPADARAAAFDVHAQWFGRAQKVETELKKDLKELQDQCERPVYVRALIDIFAEDFFPQWSPEIEAKEQKWQRTLSNIGESVINKIRSALEKDGTLHLFQNKIVRGGLAYAGNKVHLMNLPVGAKAAILACVKSFNNKTWDLVVELMIAAILNDKEQVEKLLKKLESPELNFDQVPDLTRERILKVEDVTATYFNEDEIKKIFIKQKPVVVVLEENKVVYIKFSKFSDALDAWNLVVDKENIFNIVRDGAKKHVTIVNEHSFEKGKYEKPYKIQIACTVAGEKNDEKFESSANYSPAREDGVHKRQEKDAKGRKVSIEIPYTAYMYRSYLDAKEKFDENKNNLKMLCPNLTDEEKDEWIKLLPGKQN